MRLTPLDIRKQEFRKGMRGLDSDEVYAFLNTVADEYEAVLNDNKALRERLLELDDKVMEYRNMEKTLRDTLVTAERVTEEAKESARREAELIIKKAELEADRGARSITENATRLRQEIQMLKRQRDSYIARMKALLQSYLTFVEGAERDFSADDEQIAAAQSPALENRSPAKPAPAPAAQRRPETMPSERRDTTPGTGEPKGTVLPASPRPAARSVAGDSKTSRPGATEPAPERAPRALGGTSPVAPTPPTGESGRTLSAILDRMAERDAKHPAEKPIPSREKDPTEPDLGLPSAGPLAEELPSDELGQGESGDHLIEDADRHLWSLDRLKRDILGHPDDDGDR